MRVLPLLVSGCIMDTQLWAPGDDPNDPDLPRVDLDADGFSRDEGDCDDDAPLVFPDADDVCDGLDNDCSGVSDVGWSGLDTCNARWDFTQTLRADILIVLDNTESMTPHWSKAADGACAMVEHLLGKAYDTHIGVIMTDMQTPTAMGNLIEVSTKDGSSPWITGDAEGLRLLTACNWLGNALGDVQTYTPVEPDPSGGRAAVDAAMFEHGDDHNNGFFRPEADLAILFINDEEDTSLPESGEFLNNLTKSKMGSGGRVSIHAITQVDDEDCEGHKTEAPADTLLELVAQTSGMYESYCMAEYMGFLSGVGQDIADKALGDRFRLPQEAPARVGTIEVTIVTPTDSYPWAGGVALEDPWTLVFAPPNLPPAGANIQVDYKIDWQALR